MSKNNLTTVFRSSEGLLKLYRKKKLDHIIAKFSDYINTSSYLGGSKCSAFLLPNKKEVLKITLKSIKYFRDGYYQIFRKHNVKANDQLDSVQFLQHQINSMGNYFSQIKEILYSDEDVFVYLQDYCTPFKEYMIAHPDQVDPQIIKQVIQLVQYMISNNVLITEIGPSNIGLSESGKVLIYDYDGLRPLREIIIQKPSDWWGFQLGSLLYYLSFIFQPKKIDWYRSHRHKWGHQLKDFKIAQKDFPSCVYDVIKAYTIFDKNIETQIGKIISSLESCLTQIAEDSSLVLTTANPSQISSLQIQKSLNSAIKPHAIKKLEKNINLNQKLVYKFHPKKVETLSPSQKPTREQICQLRLKYFEKKMENKSSHIDLIKDNSLQITSTQKEIPEKEIHEAPKSPHENDLVIIIPSHAIKTENINKDSIIVKWIEPEKLNEVL